VVVAEIDAHQSTKITKTNQFSQHNFMLNWLNLTEINQLDDLLENSVNQKVIIFKHSTRCSISVMVKDRLERNWSKDLENQEIYYLDLLNYRDVSNAIADKTGVEHQSPQVVIIENGICIFSANHNFISADAIKHELMGN
jgi:bacillithiol system protein YtxJ